ncbi:MAG: hypothetical protein LBJ08_02390 [Bifidobacteriaceae bacterium]|nr:hypothetical protein [Bifidobacteriaceae bacterium]
MDVKSSCISVRVNWSTPEALAATGNTPAGTLTARTTMAERSFRDTRISELYPTPTGARQECWWGVARIPSAVVAVVVVVIGAV